MLPTAESENVFFILILFNFPKLTPPQSRIYIIQRHNKLRGVTPLPHKLSDESFKIKALNSEAMPKNVHHDTWVMGGGGALRGASQSRQRRRKTF